LDSEFCKHTIQNNSEDSMGVEPPYPPLWVRQWSKQIMTPETQPSD